MSNIILGFFLRLYIKLNGIKVKIAETTDDLNEAFDLRKKVYESEDYSNELNYPDEYDPHSIIINAYKDKSIVGSMRLSSVKQGAFCFDLCNPDIPAHIDLAQIVEYGALVVDKKFRKSNSLIFIALTEIAFRTSVKYNFKYWYGYSIPKQIKHFQKINPHCTLLEMKKPTAKSLARRERFSQYFEKYGAISRPFLFELGKVNYLDAIFLVLKASIKKRQLNNKKNTTRVVAQKH